MVANFFKQSKPIVYLTLLVLLSAFYFINLFEIIQLNLEWTSYAFTFTKFVALLLCFIVFERTIKNFEIQKGHVFGGLLFVLFSNLAIAEIISTNEVFCLALVSISIMRLFDLNDSVQKTLPIFEATFLIYTASLIYAPAIYFLLLVLVGTLLFTTPNWRYFVVPILAISAVIILVEMYTLMTENLIVGLTFFIPVFKFDYQVLKSPTSIFLYLFWIFSAILTVKQLLKIKKIRSSYHKKIATFFLAYVGIAFVSHWLTASSVCGLWLLSLWPFCLYMGDFLSRLKKRLWLELYFWGFVVLSLSVFFA